MCCNHIKTNFLYLSGFLKRRLSRACVLSVRTHDTRTYVGGWVLSPPDYRRKDQSRVNVLNIKGKFVVVVVLFFVCLACEWVCGVRFEGVHAIVGFVNKTKQLCNMALHTHIRHVYIYIYTTTRWVYAHIANSADSYTYV